MLNKFFNLRRIFFCFPAYAIPAYVYAAILSAFLLFSSHIDIDRHTGDQHLENVDLNQINPIKILEIQFFSFNKIIVIFINLIFNLNVSNQNPAIKPKNQNYSPTWIVNALYNHPSMTKKVLRQG